MKFLQYTLWTQYLQTEAQKHTAHIYGIVCRDAFARREFVQALLSRISSPEHVEQTYSLEDVAFKLILEELEAYSLFATKKILSIEGIETLGVKEQKILAEALQRAPQNTHVIWSSERLLSPIYTACSKSTVLLDLSKEKPWDAKKRHTYHIQRLLQKAQKKIQPDALEAFTQRVGDSLATWVTEMQKVVSYVGDATYIQLRDIEAIVSVPVEQAQWKMAERLVFDPAKYTRLQHIDMPAWFTFLTAVRYYLHMGMTLKAQVQSHQELKFGKTAPSHLARNAPLCQRYDAHFFARAICVVFEMELQSKQFPSQPLHLFERLELALAQLRTGKLLPQYNSLRIGV